MEDEAWPVPPDVVSGRSREWLTGDGSSLECDEDGRWWARANMPRVRHQVYQEIQHSAAMALLCRLKEVANG